MLSSLLLYRLISQFALPSPSKKFSELIFLYNGRKMHSKALSLLRRYSTFDGLLQSSRLT